jgi:hypothetical protein
VDELLWSLFGIVALAGMAWWVLRHTLLGMHISNAASAVRYRVRDGNWDGVPKQHDDRTADTDPVWARMQEQTRALNKARYEQAVREGRVKPGEPLIEEPLGEQLRKRRIEGR